MELVEKIQIIHEVIMTVANHEKLDHFWNRYTLLIIVQKNFLLTSVIFL